jgi:hypothetical protein
MAAPTFDLPAAHRWFAIEYNNQAWDLVEAAQRSPEDIDRMVHRAHAAATHWSEIEKPVNQMRALALLAHAYAVAGEGKPAVKYARRCADLSASLTDEQTSFDRASAAACMACAFRCDGQANEAQAWDANARSFAAKLDDADDRQVIERLLSLGST